jgi:hypothetical protein
MPSPFPGMDPYLEDPWLWPDFHLSYAVGVRAALARRLPAGYAALVDRYVWVQEPQTGERARLGKPDVLLTGERPLAAAGPAAAVAAPLEVVLPVTTEKGSPYVKILDQRMRRLVTVLELLSPANKTPGKDREAFLLKHHEYLGAQVNLVKIDLLRQGERLPWGLPPGSRADYYVMVSRAAERPRARVWPFSVRDAMPTIPIPLTPPDADLELALGECLQAVYDDAGYARELDYSQPPRPPLDEPDASWARQLLANRAP